MTAQESRWVDIRNALDRIEAQTSQIQTVLVDIKNKRTSDAGTRRWFSPKEVAEVLGKKPFTVREWCRLQRIKARKRPTGRGDADEWEISADELERYKNHGLLPLPVKY